jgi:DNA-binding PadR family transcriptional regulator
MAEGERDPGDELPLSPLDFSVLLVLAEGASYGYGIVKAIAERSAGSVRLAPGNLYQVLDRLLDKAWIRDLHRSELPDEADGRRRYYAITEVGRAVAAAEARRLQAMLPRAARLDLVPTKGTS